MKLVAGLGNPSPKYDRTRHNLGREVVLRLGASLGIITGESPEPNALNIPSFKGKAYRGMLNDEEVILAPDLGTFMNESGPALASILSFFKIPSENLILVHDELAFPSGTVRLGKDISAAGHNGVASVIATIGTQDFVRLRLGCESRLDHQVPSEDFVLQKMSDEDWSQTSEMLNTAEQALATLLEKGLEQAMNKFH